MTARTTAPHTRSFARFPRVRAGEVVRGVRDDGRNPGWFQATAPDGTEGYFPGRWFALGPDGTTARALRDYDATELTIAAGVAVEPLAEEAGWVLVRTTDGSGGWIPAACLDPDSR